jgi:hydrogenase maturation protease
VTNASGHGRHAASPRRVLVAGIGNVLRGDDGFGPAVVRALGASGPLPAGVRVVELGIGGIALVQELMDGYDALIVVDAVDRGGAPGAVCVLEPDVPAAEALAPAERHRLAGDMHATVPARALVMARAAGVLPPFVRLVGCEPEQTEEFSTDLSPAVARAVDGAVGAIRAMLAELPADPVAELARRDEVLTLMFWLQAEGLGADVALDEIVKFVGDPPAVERALAQLGPDGHVDLAPDGRYRLTALGVEEGRRRFLDEFEPYLARSAHGECGPDCDCRRGQQCRGPAA